MRRRNVLDDLNNKLAVDYKPKGTQDQVESVSGDNAPENSFTGETPVATAPSSLNKEQQAETPQSTQQTQPAQPIETQQVEKATTPADNSAFIEKMTTKNVFAEKNKDVIAPKSTSAQQGFNIPEPKREEFDTYEKQINFFNLPETEEERLAREKKERSSKNLSALFDGLTALSNIYHTTQYAPPQTLTSGTEKMTQKYDKLRENADKIKKEYQNAILKLRQLDDADYQNAWNRWFALRKQYENGEISRQKMQQEWEQFQIQKGLKEKELGLKKEGLEQKDKHHQDNLKEGAKNRAVQGENKKGENGKTLNYRDYSITIPKGFDFNNYDIYEAIRKDVDEGKLIIPGVKKGHFPPYDAIKKGTKDSSSDNDAWKSQNGEDAETYISRIIENYAGNSPRAREWFVKRGATVEKKTNEPSEEVEDYQPVIDYKPKK